MPPTLDEAIEQLLDRRSPRRRSAARRLRTLADPSAGPALLAAWQREICDPRTWETQYQMTMSVGACRHRPAYGPLRELAGIQLAASPTSASTLGIGLGDALTRLEWADGRALPTAELLLGPAADADPAARSLMDGVLRALATVRIVPEARLRRELLRLGTHVGVHDLLSFWLVVAAAGWPPREVASFLAAASRSIDQSRTWRR